MAIDMKAAAEKWSTVNIEPLRSWSRRGHEVMLARLTGPKPADGSAASTEVHLICECDFDVDENGEHRSDPSECRAREQVRKACMAKAVKANRDTWHRMGIEKAVVDIHRRVEKAEYFGQNTPSIIFVQEVAELLGVPIGSVHDACIALRRQEKLDLNGYILVAHEPRFRFPEELRSMFRFMVEEPLGWPNGQAGDGFLEEVEGCIDEHTDLKHGKDAFWEHNFPNVAPHILVMFGHRWLDLAAARAAKGGADAADLAWTRLEVVAADLEKLAGRFRSLSKHHVPLIAEIGRHIVELKRVVRVLDKALKKTGGSSLQAAGVAEVARMLDVNAFQLGALDGGHRPLKRSGAAVAKVASRLHRAVEKPTVQARTVRAALKRLRVQIDRLDAFRRSLSQ